MNVPSAVHIKYGTLDINMNYGFMYLNTYRIFHNTDSCLLWVIAIGEGVNFTEGEMFP